MAKKELEQLKEARPRPASRAEKADSRSLRRWGTLVQRRPVMTS